MSAFSLCLKQLKKDCSLILDDNKNNLSVIDVLNKSNVDTYLFSTQGSLGGHNLATKLIFNTKEKNFSTSDAFFYTNQITMHVSYFYSSLTNFLNFLIQAIVYFLYLL